MIKTFDQRLLEALAESIRRRRFCLVLGAGAAVDDGMPQWQRLIKELVYQADLPELDGTDHDLLHLFDLLRSDRDILQNLRSALYRAPGAGPSGSRSKKRPGEARWAQDEKAYDLLAILAVMTALYDADEARADPDKVRPFHVMSYNLDTLLEERISALGHTARAVLMSPDNQAGPLWPAPISSESRPLVGLAQEESQLGTSVEVRVFHPHGLVLRPDEPGKVMEPSGQSSRRWVLPESFDDLSTVVLGRRDYNDLFGKTLDDRNLGQLAAFRGLQCLFYGFSFTDPNVDRLLQLAKDLGRQGDQEAGPQHVALRRFTAGSIKKEETSPPTESAQGGDGSAGSVEPSRWQSLRQRFRPDSHEWTLEHHLFARETARLEKMRVRSRGFRSFDAHKQFLSSLIREMAWKHKVQIPGNLDIPI